MTTATEAPYGHRADGTPRGKPGPKPSGQPRSSTRTRASGGRPRARRSGPKAPAASSAPRTPKPAAPNYQQAVSDLLATIAVPLAFHPATLPDAAALLRHGPGMAHGAAVTAAHVPAFAAVLDRALKSTPYVAILEGALPLGAQIAVNHGWLPYSVGKRLGAVPREQLLADFLREQAAEQAQAERDLADATAFMAAQQERTAAGSDVGDQADDDGIIGSMSPDEWIADRSA